MAIWQFKMWFVPADFVGNRNFLAKQECEETAWSYTLQLPEDFQTRLSTILPIHKSWHEQLLQWGTQTGDLIEVWMDGDKVVFIEARIDCRNLNTEFMRQLFMLAGEWGFRLVYPRYAMVLPGVWDDFMRAVSESPNLKFLQNPTEWLPKLAKEAKQDDTEN